MKKTLLLGLMTLLVAAGALAANNPGHDVLYIEQSGDSELAGKLNISEDLRVANRFYSTYLDILGNGTQPAGSNNRVWSSATDLYIETSYNIIMNSQLGTSNWLRLGDDASDTVGLNVTGSILVKDGQDITVGGTSVCLANGTNCLSGNNTGNVTSVTAGDGLSNSGTADEPILDVNTGAGLEVDSDNVRIAAGAAGNGLTGGGGSALAVGEGSGITVNANDVAINASYTQRRVSSCGAGQAISTIAEDGSVTCESTSGASSSAGWVNSSTETNTSLYVNMKNSASITGGLNISGTLQFGSDVQLSRGAANRLDLASGDSLNLVSGALQVAGTTRVDSSGVGSFAAGTTVTGHSITESGSQALRIDATPSNEIQMNSSGNTNISITADGGSVIITLG